MHPLFLPPPLHLPPPELLLITHKLVLIAYRVYGPCHRTRVLIIKTDLNVVVEPQPAKLGSELAAFRVAVLVGAEHVFGQELAV
jgi:hypothetical protein